MDVVSLGHCVQSHEPGFLREALLILSHDVDSPAYKMLRELCATYPLIFGCRSEPTSCLDAIDALCSVIEAADELVRDPGLEQKPRRRSNAHGVLVRGPSLVRGRIR